MKFRKIQFLHALKWQTVQICFIFLFLLILYFQENRIIEAIIKPGMQWRGIRTFLNAMQFPVLPDAFFLLVLPLIIVSISLLLFKKWRFYFLAISGALLAALLSADRIYYAFFTSIIKVQSFSAAGQLGDVRSAIFEAIQLTDLAYISSFGIFIVFGRYYNKKVSMGLSRNKSAFLMDKTLSIVFFLLSVYCYNIAFYIPQRYVLMDTTDNLQVSETKIKSASPTTFIPMFKSSDVDFAATFGVVNFHMKNLVDNFIFNKQAKALENPPQSEELFEFFKRKHQLNAMNSPFSGIAKGRNVFLIHFESLNPAVVGENIGGDDVTPTLSRLLENGFYWNHILDQVKIGGSSDAEFSTLTGMLASTSQISAFNTACMPHIPALPRVLRNNGYQTISLHGYKASFWNRNITHPILGFEKMYFKKSYTYSEKVGMGISDKEFFSQALDLLRAHKSPFFAYLITLSSHYPYEGIPEKYKPLFQKSLPSESMLKDYLQSVRFVDDAVGELITKAKIMGLWDNSIFVFYGDHRPGADEEMNNELIRLTGRSLTTARYSCVPIIIVIPGQEEYIHKYRDDYQEVVGGLYDIFPTIMHLLGIDCPFGVYGSNLFVKNSERDPAPFYRYPGCFVYNGIQYFKQGLKIAKDTEGILFTNNRGALGLNISEAHALWLQAQKEVQYLNYAYQTNLDLASLNP